tara:strand:- start:289 stop:633 length:345 start_codon:yes stop_codon:yes gene_type:complete
MPNKHFCQGPTCHTQTTQDRFLKSRGVVRGRYAYAKIDEQRYYGSGDKYFCSQRCKFDWLETNMENIEQGRPIEFIRHRRESGGYEKTSETVNHGWGDRTYTSIKRVDNRTELD